MAGVFDGSPATFYWVWSARGKAYRGLEHGKWWIDGMLPFPVDGPTTESLMLDGYHSTPYDPTKRLSHWEGNNLQWRPVFVDASPPSKSKAKASRKAGLDYLVS